VRQPFHELLSPSILKELLRKIAEHDLKGSRSDYKPRTRLADTSGAF